MKIFSKRFILRDFVEDDAPAFLAYHEDPRALEFYGPQETHPGYGRELLGRFMLWAAEQPRRNYQFAVEQRREPRSLIGSCGVRTAKSEQGTGELGVELAPAYWGRYGYALEAASAILDFGFDELLLQELYGSTANANERVVRLARWVGAVAEDRPTPYWMASRGWRCTEWRIKRRQWELTRPALRALCRL
ncbi:MAG: GNAT family N-acetyltransferase [Nitrospira sp.]